MSFSLLLAVLFFAQAFVLAVLLLRGHRRGDRREGEAGELRGKVDELARSVSATVAMLDQRIGYLAQMTERSHSSTQDVIRDIASQLTEQRSALGRVLEQSKDIARLQEILQPPRARGALGEKLLENILAQHLPGGEKAGLWQKQFAFRSGERVDFVIRAGDLLIPIDSKFPMDAYERLKHSSPEGRERAQREFAQTVKQHAEAIRKKYIVPQEGTADFAMLYIPSEGVYAEIIALPELTDSIFDRAIIPISPGTFFAYLRTILIGLRGMQVASSARQILAGLKALEQELTAFGERFRIAGGHLRNALRAYDDAEQNLEKFAGQLNRLRTIPEDDTQKQA